MRKGRRSTVNNALIDKFCRLIIQGKTQAQAYLGVFPNKKDWKAVSINTNACQLFNREDVQQRYKKMLDKAKKAEFEKACWSREQAIQELKYVIEQNKYEIEKRDEAYREELFMLEEMLMESPEKARDYLQKKLTAKRRQTVFTANNVGIISAVSELNKLSGLCNEQTNIQANIQFVGEEAIED